MTPRAALAHRVLGSVAVAVALACGPPPAPRSGELRVISLSPSLTRILLALDAGDRIVGVDRFSRELEGVRDKPSLGGLFAADLERSIELRPSLILAVDSAQQEGFFAQARARGVQVETFRGHTLQDVLDSFRRVGGLVGRGEEGAQLAQRVSSELDRLAATGAPGYRPSVAVVIESDPLYVVGGGSFVNDLIDAAGGRNAFADLPRPYPRVALEALADRAPDVLVDTTFAPSEMADAEQRARERWHRFTWVKRVEVLPQGILTLPGPDLPEAARLLRERIAP